MSMFSLKHSGLTSSVSFLAKDKTIRVWNYLTGKVELVKRFPVEVTVIELYASGQYAAVGFVDKVKIMQIFMDDLNVGIIKYVCLIFFKI